MYRLSVLILIFLVVSCTKAIAPSVVVEAKPTLIQSREIPEFVKDFETEFQENLIDSKSPGAAMVVIKDNEILWMKGYGLRDTETGDTVDVNSVFRIASLSKGFTGVLAGKMVQEGCIGWEDKICESVPDFTLQDQDQARRITVKHILSHSSGLVRHAYTNFIELGMSIRETIPFFAELPVFGREGTHFAYQNVAFSLIEEVLEDKTGDPFHTILEESLFTNLDMKNASCSYEAITTNDNVALPHWYSSRRKRYVPRTISDKYYNVISAGGINASISDMANWLHLLVGNRQDVVDQETLDYVFQPIIKSNKRKHNTWKGVENCAYGIGWRVFDYYGKPIVYHGGYVDNYRSEVVIDRESKVAVCVLFNAPVSYASKVVPSFLEHYRKSEQIVASSTETFRADP